MRGHPWWKIPLVIIAALLLLDVVVGNALHRGIVMFFYLGATEGEVQPGSTIYAAKDRQSLHLLSEAMGDMPYLTPDQGDDVLGQGRGEIVRLKSPTHVRYKGALGDDGRELQNFDFERHGRVVLKVQVLDGPLAHSIVLIPKNYSWAIGFAGRSAFP